MQTVRKFYHWVNLLSLDIVSGAILSALYFSELLEVRILPYGLVALGLSVWIIYTADHLKDAWAIQLPATSERHRYHQENFKILFALMMLAAAICCVIIFFTRKPVLEWGLILASVVVLYLLIQKYLKILKELFVAGLYTCGVLLPSISVSSKNIGAAEIIVIVMFAVSAWINLLVFSWFDHENDLKDHQHSFSTLKGKQFTYRTILGLTALNILFFLFLLIRSSLIPEAFVPFLISLFLFGLLINNRRVSDDFRKLGDAAFYIPGLFWIWHQL